MRFLNWNDDELDGKGFVPWETLTHPQLGEVEVGGWDWMYSTRNPPTKLLEETSKKGCDFALAHAACLPKLSMDVKISVVDSQTKRVDLLLRNDGFLPTYITEIARKGKIVNPTTLQFDVDDSIEIIEGKARQRIEHLDGIFNRNIPRHSAMSISGSTDRSRRKVSFIVKGNGQIKIQWFGDRIGALEKVIQLEN